MPVGNRQPRMLVQALKKADVKFLDYFKDEILVPNVVVQDGVDLAVDRGENGGQPLRPDRQVHLVVIDKPNLGALYDVKGVRGESCSCQPNGLLVDDGDVRCLANVGDQRLTELATLDAFEINRNQR